MSANMFIDPTSRQFGFAPPSESLVEDVQITFDTEMVDEEEVLALQQQNIDSASTALFANGVSTETPQGVEVAGMETDTVQINLEKVHLRGVDTMATADIEVWERKWVGEEGGIVRVQWIDDSSCNLIYRDAGHARKALDLLTDPDSLLLGVSQLTPVQHADLLFIRTARACEAHPNAKLEVRIARMDDVKQKGARERSRFYLFNPEYDRGEEYERRNRRERRRDTRRDRDRDRDRDLSPPDDGGYSRRPYSRQEQERRTCRDRDVMMYDDSMYDDSGNQWRQRDRSRSHSPTCSRSGSKSRYHSNSRRRSRSRQRWRSRSPPLPPPRERSIELFPELASKEPRGIMGHHGEDRFYNPPMKTVTRVESGENNMVPPRATKSVELFPEKNHAVHGVGLKSILGLAVEEKSQGTKELFPEKLGSSKGDLAARISMPGSTPGGILGYHSGGGLENATSSKKKKNTTEDDLFAEKMAMGRKVGLDLFDRIEIPHGENVGGSGSSKRKGRRKAADMFS